MRIMDKLTRLIPKRFRGADDDDPDSMVLLLRESHVFTKEELSAAATRAWNRTFEDSERSRHFVVQQGLVTFVKVGSHFLNILHANTPYFGHVDDGEFENFLPEAERRLAWRAHHAWCAVDHMIKGTDEQTKYCVLAALVAEMVNDNCSGVWIPKFRHFMPNAVFKGMLLYPELQRIARSKEIDID